jgi:hypothetical protein
MTSIEWLIESIKSLDKSLLNKIISIEEYNINLKWVIQQAKEMHKQEIMNAYNQGASDAYPNGSYIEGNTYYQETFKKDYL